MAELEQDAALLLPPAAGVALMLLLLELSLAQPARPALAASMAIAAMAATVICLIPALLVCACKIKRIIIPNGRGACLRAAPSHREAKGGSCPLLSIRRRVLAPYGPDVPQRRRDARRAGALHDRGRAAGGGAAYRAVVPVLLGPRRVPCPLPGHRGRPAHPRRAVRRAHGPAERTAGHRTPRARAVHRRARGRRAVVRHGAPRGRARARHPQGHHQPRRVAGLPRRRAQRGAGEAADSALTPPTHTPATSAGVARAKILASA